MTAGSPESGSKMAAIAQARELKKAGKRSDASPVRQSPREPGRTTPDC